MTLIFAFVGLFLLQSNGQPTNVSGTISCDQIKELDLSAGERVAFSFTVSSTTQTVIFHTCTSGTDVDPRIWYWYNDGGWNSPVCDDGSTNSDGECTHCDFEYAERWVVTLSAGSYYVETGPYSGSGIIRLQMYCLTEFFYDNMNVVPGSWQQLSSQPAELALVANPQCSNVCWNMGVYGYTYYSRTISTLGYQNIVLSFYFYESGFNENQYCQIKYNSSNSIYTMFEQPGDYDTFGFKLKTLTATAADKTKLTVFLESPIGVGSCFFDELKLFGLPINPTTATPTSTTSNPTTSNPTTSNPTTSNPTTATPTTNNPTTNNPTTNNPTTNNPTTNNPTTNNPTTNNPTTNNPTTSNPTLALAPTPASTNDPTDSLTKDPTPAPTVLFCGDADTGAYTGGVLRFDVQLAYHADLVFDISASDFAVTTIEGYTLTSVAQGEDTDNDEILTLFNALPGDYYFNIYSATTGIYDLTITCNYPTAASVAPTKNPTSAPTVHPIHIDESTTRESKNSDNTTFIVVIVVVLIILILIVLLFFHKQWRKRVKETKLEMNTDTNVNNMEMGTQHLDPKPEFINDYDIITSINETDIGSNSNRVSDNITLMKLNSISNENEVIEILETINATAGDDIDGFIVGDDSENEDGPDSVKETMGADHVSGTGEQEQQEGVNYNLNEDGAKEVRAWLDSIGFSMYYDVFIRNGFDSMELIKEIVDKNDLDDIGITLKGHQLGLLKHLKKSKTDQ